LLFYQGYAIVDLKVNKNKKNMSPENTPVPEVKSELLITVPDWNEQSPDHALPMDAVEPTPAELPNGIENAEVKISRYPLGTNVIVERNVYDENGEPTGQVIPDNSGWKVESYGYKNGKEVAIVTKENEDGTWSKSLESSELAEIQVKYSPETVPQIRQEAIVRKTGNEELKAAGIIEPSAREASVDESEVNEETQPRVDSAWDAVPYVEESKPSASEIIKAPLTPQEKYDAAKKELNDFVAENEFSDLDVHYLEQFAKAGRDNYNEQTVLVSKMSTKALDFAGRFQKLYDEKQRLRS
jgi:hypothetical protein